MPDCVKRLWLARTGKPHCAPFCATTAALSVSTACCDRWGTKTTTSDTCDPELCIGASALWHRQQQRLQTVTHNVRENLE